MKTALVVLILICGLPQIKGAIPQLVGQANGYNGFANQFYHLFCNIYGDNVRYEWYLDDQPISSTKFLSFGNRLIVLKTPASPDYEGRYRCKASNQDGSTTSPDMIVRFKVRLQFHEPHDQTTTVKVTIGKDFQLNCPSHTSPSTIHYNWGGRRPFTGVWHIKPRAHYMVMKDGALLFANVKNQDIENFNVVYDGVSCGIETKESGKMTFSKKFLLKQSNSANTKPFGPTIKTLLEDEIVDIGTTHYVLRCGAVGLPTPSYSWNFTGFDGKRQAIKNGENGYHLSLYGHMLIIQTIQVKHDGIYECEARSSYNGSYHIDKVNARITVRGKPRWSPHGQLKEANAVLGRRYKWRCDATSLPKPTYSWHFNGTKLLHSEAYSTFGGELTFHKIEKSNVGQYECIAQNKFGKISSSAELRLIPASEVCKKAKVNLIFLIDGSSSVSSTILNGFQNFTKSLIAKFNVGENDTLVHILHYGETIDVSRQNEKKYGNITGITFGLILGEYSLDGSAMKMANDMMVKKGRTDATNVMVLLMDNGLRDFKLFKKQTEKLRQKGTRLIMVDTKYDNNNTTTNLVDMALKYTQGNVEENINKVTLRVCL